MKNIPAYLLKGLLSIFAALPLPVHHFNARILAFILGKVVRYRRDDVISNIARAFPIEDYSMVKRTAGEFYRHLADIIVESVWFGGCRNPERLRKSEIVKLLNPEIIAQMDRRPGGWMVLCSHCGNWELLGGLAAGDCYSPGIDTPFTEETLCVSYRAMSSDAWDWVMRKNRFAPVDESRITGYMETKSLVRFILSHKDEKKYYHMITDQRPYLKGSDKMTVNFMGHPCTTMSAAAGIAKRVGLPVMFLKMKQLSRGHYGIEYIPICEDPSTMSEQEIMEKYYSLLEDEIREQPFNYLWTHRRWPNINSRIL